MQKLFEVVETDGRTVQKCTRCPYVSPVITNGEPNEISAGLRIHLKKSHNIKNV